MEKKLDQNLEELKIDKETLEKIDYIYKYIKFQKRISYTFSFLKFMIFLLVIYFIYSIWIQNHDNLSKALNQKIINIVKPIVSDLIIDMNQEIKTDLEKQINQDLTNNIDTSNSDILQKYLDNKLKQ